MKNIITNNYFLGIMIFFSILWLGADIGKSPNTDDWLAIILLEASIQTLIKKL